MGRTTLLTLLMLAALGVAGYLERDFVIAEYGKLKERFFPSETGRRPTTAARPTPPPTAGGDTARPEAPAQSPGAQTTPRVSTRPRPPRTSQFPTGANPSGDEPFVSNDTGTIDPGMSEQEVYAKWGQPAGVRHSGVWTYLYFRNGCEKSCGTYDVVFIQSGKVVDAVLRWPGHHFSGQSTSPAGVVPIPTRTGDTLVVPPPTP